jgi:hypothetical protein
MKTEKEYIKAETDKYMRTKQYKEEHDTQSAQEVKERMKELFTEKQLKIIDKLAEDIFGSPEK